LIPARFDASGEFDRYPQLEQLPGPSDDLKLPKGVDTLSKIIGLSRKSAVALLLGWAISPTELGGRVEVPLSLGGDDDLKLVRFGDTTDPRYSIVRSGDLTKSDRLIGFAVPSEEAGVYGITSVDHKSTEYIGHNSIAITNDASGKPKIGFGVSTRNAEERALVADGLARGLSNNEINNLISTSRSLRISATKRKARLNALGFQEHHAISPTNKATRNHPLIKAAGFDLESRSNKIFLPKDAATHPARSIHNGRHDGEYSRALRGLMTQAYNQGQAAGWGQAQYRAELDRIISQERAVLRTGMRALNRNARPGATRPRR
jgi:hypothetical protein